MRLLNYFARERVLEMKDRVSDLGSAQLTHNHYRLIYVLMRLTALRRLVTMADKVPTLSCLGPGTLLLPEIRFQPTTTAGHPLEDPELDRSTIPRPVLKHLEQAAHDLHQSRLVAVPTETVYGLGAATKDPIAVSRVYALKGRPADNPLIVHVSSLRMLRERLLPESNGDISPLYMALIDAFWPGPLTLLFPARHPPPPPAPQTTAVRMPGHPLARALIAIADEPISAPSANSSGRPSPTRAAHVARDLGEKGVGILGCILDGGSCDVGLESTVVDGHLWGESSRILKVLRPGGISVEAIEAVVKDLDDSLGLQGEERTRILVHGRDEPLQSVKPVSNPSTPGMKYRHYSPSVPVYLFYPSNAFKNRPAQSAILDASSAIQAIVKSNPKLGLMLYDSSPLSQMIDAAQVSPHRVSLGSGPETAARALFGGMLQLEAVGVDAIVIEACPDIGLGLAVMERINKAVGGGGQKGLATDAGVTGEKRFWVDVTAAAAGGGDQNR